jgi:hypothetical protein
MPWSAHELLSAYQFRGLSEETSDYRRRIDLYNHVEYVTGVYCSTSQEAKPLIMSKQPQEPIGTFLSKYSTCDISDALLRLGILTGGFLPSLSLWSPHRKEGPTRVAGPAYTVKFVRNHQKNAPVLAEHYVRPTDPPRGQD